MFCPECKCEFVGWKKSCPVCNADLVEGPLEDSDPVGEPISYGALVEQVRENGGRLEIDLSTVSVGTERRQGFPYVGFKFAWAKRMRGYYNESLVDLTTTEVGREKARGFPYQGYGFAWVKCMEGSVGGNSIVLAATKVQRKRTQGFPYKGFGFAWAQELSGECGERLKAHLAVTDVGRKSGWRFPYFGYGSAWENRGVLTLTLKA